MTNNIIEQISIPEASAVRGNITLITKIDGALIEWHSSNPEVISDKAEGKMAAGVVKRGDKDVCVTLTATITQEDGSIRKAEFKVNVLKAPKKISDDDFDGYLFGHFIGEGSADGEQIYFGISEDGLNFKDMNACKPVLTSNIGECGVRDPFICRSHEGDRYFLIATDLSIYNRGGWFVNEQGYYDASTTGSSNLVLWESDDLVNWKEPRLLNVAPKNAGMAWAPEIIYDDETGEYVVFFASSIMNPETKYKAKPNAIYYVATRDFVHFSDTAIFIDNQTDNAVDGKPREIIDTTVIKVGDIYYSASKDGDNAEENGGIRILRTKNLRNPDSWEKVLNLSELGLDLTGKQITRLDNSMLEGPELFRYNKKDWADPNVPEYGIMADQYAVGAGYLPLVTTNLEDATNATGAWKLLDEKDYSFDKLKKRHGTILPITKAEKERLIKAFMK